MAPKILVAIGLVLLVAVAVRLLLPRGRSARYPYARKAALFSPAERSFLGVLEQAVGKHYRIFGKVRVADVIDVNRGLSRTDWQRAFNRINAKHFDYLLCDREDLSVVCAIELDDKSHGRSSRRERDAFLDEVCRNVELPLLRIPASKTYSLPDIRVKILEATRRKLEPLLSPDPAPAPRPVAAPRLAPTVRLMNEKIAYAVAIAGGAALWLATGALTGEREAWDSSAYWTVAYPLSIALAGALGWLAPREPWRWGLAVMLAQAVALAVATTEFGLLPLGLILFGVLSLPAILLARLAALIRRRLRA